MVTLNEVLARYQLPGLSHLTETSGTAPEPHKALVNVVLKAADEVRELENRLVEQKREARQLAKELDLPILDLGELPPEIEQRYAELGAGIKSTLGELRRVRTQLKRLAELYKHFVDQAPGPREDLVRPAG